MSELAEQIYSVPQKPTKQNSPKHRLCKDNQIYDIGLSAEQFSLNVSPTNEMKSDVLRHHCAVTVFMHNSILIHLTNTIMFS